VLAVHSIQAEKKVGARYSEKYDPEGRGGG